MWAEENSGPNSWYCNISCYFHCFLHIIRDASGEDFMDTPSFWCIICVAELGHTYHQKNIGGSTKQLWSLIPYIYYPWLQSPKNCANNYSELYFTKKISDASFRYIFLEDWSQSEKNSEIKPPLGWHSLSIIELPRDPHHIFPCMFQGHWKWLGE